MDLNVKKQKKYYPNLVFILFIIIFSLSLPELTESLIEIPVRTLNITGIPKYPHLNNPITPSDSQSKEEDKLIYDNNLHMMIQTGETKINQNFLFVCDIQLGSLEQTFSMVLDTGSFILWVAQKDSKDTSKINNHFDPSTSSTCKSAFESMDITYGTGGCKGNYYYDNIKFLNKKFNMKFGVATQTDFSVYADGIIGLPKIESKSSSSFIEMLYRNRIVDSTVFSFKFDEQISLGSKGKLYIGEHSDFSSSNVTSCDLLDSSGYDQLLWTCRLKGFTLSNGNNEVSASGRYSILFDTGTNAIFLPRDYLVQIKDDLSILGCSIYFNKNTYRLQCKNLYNLPRFHFEIDGNTYILPSELVFFTEGGVAYSNVYFNSDDSDVLIMGSPFFIAFHTLFDKENEKLSFFPMDPDLIIPGSNVGTMILYVFLIFILFGLLIYLIYRFYIWKKAKEAAAYQQPSYNYFSSLY